MIWHIFMEIGAKVKNILRLSHLLKQLRLEAKNTTFIFHVREPPTLTSSLGNWSENFFDATMTYRRDSDIFNALYELVPKITMSSSTVYN